MTLRLVVMGTPAFAVPALLALGAAGHDIACVYSQPPRPAGRGQEPARSPMHVAALEAGLPVRTPLHFKDAADVQELAALEADALVVVAYGLILPAAALLAARLGAYNLHASALPRWRGAAPIQRAIMAGDTATAVMVMRMGEGLDTGPICLQQPIGIGPDETAGALADRLSGSGAGLMVAAMAALEEGNLRETPQAGEGVAYARKIDKAEARLDFSRPAREVHDCIRGLSPFPGAWFELAREGARPERIKVLEASLAEGNGAPGSVLDTRLTIACLEGAVRLRVVQRAGRQPARAEDFLRGFHVGQGERIGGQARPATSPPTIP